MCQNTVPIRNHTSHRNLVLCSRSFSSSSTPGYSSDTLHCTNYVLGEAVQFNSSVSAMPEHAPENSRAPVPDTADTLL
jgi:hypothetical protein